MILPPIPTPLYPAGPPYPTESPLWPRFLPVQV